MNGFVTGLDRRHDFIPFSFDIGTVGVEVKAQSSILQDPLTGGDVFGDGNPDTQGDYAEIQYYFHGVIIRMTEKSRSEGKRFGESVAPAFQEHSAVSFIPKARASAISSGRLLTAPTLFTPQALSSKVSVK